MGDSSKPGRVSANYSVRFLCVSRQWIRSASGRIRKEKKREKEKRREKLAKAGCWSEMAAGQNQWYHFGLGAPPILLDSIGDWDVH